MRGLLYLIKAYTFLNKSKIFKRLLNNHQVFIVLTINNKKEEK